MQSCHFSHIITYLTTLLIFYYGLVRTEKSKHRVFKLISFSVSSLNELGQSGVFWFVGWFLVFVTRHPQNPVSDHTNVTSGTSRSMQAALTPQLITWCHSDMQDSTYTDKLLMKHQDVSVARGIIDFAMNL